jgi:formate dehydrogenase iron-sulfur subunit
MVDGSLCAMGGLTPMPVRSALKHFAEDFGEVDDAEDADVEPTLPADEREETR